ncbi:gamma-glutamyl-gamma-aminobutyrate hydrolase family protein, partial [Agrobacterium tumefaciens]
MSRPIVAVSTDTHIIENAAWSAAPLQYLDAAAGVAGVTPILVPSTATEVDIDRVLDIVDGVIMTGSRSNVHPSAYGIEATDDHGPFDTDRDRMTLPMIRRAIERGIPLLAICRGMQELNVALDGTLANEIQEQPGNLDHRTPPDDSRDAKYGLRQTVTVKPGCLLAEITGSGAVLVNSLHRQAIDRPGTGIRVEAVADDGVIEAVSVEGAKGFVIGVQWHPEYWAESDPVSSAI